MSGEDWSRETYAGTEAAQARVIAALTPDERLALLQELLALTEASSALQRSREDKQRELNAQWRM